MSKKIFQINFDFKYAYADIVESINNTSALDLSDETPELFSDFKYGWLTKESNIIPDTIVIMSEVLGFNEKGLSLVKDIIPSLSVNQISVGSHKYNMLCNLVRKNACLNLKKSKVKKLSNGDIMEIQNPVFYPGEYPTLFKVEEMPMSFFCTETFKDVIESNSISGLTFKECPIKSKSWF